MVEIAHVSVYILACGNYLSYMAKKTSKVGEANVAMKQKLRVTVFEIENGILVEWNKEGYFDNNQFYAVDFEAASARVGEILQA